MSSSLKAFIAMAGASLMMAHQVAGKAVRDSFFLSNYPVSDLPKAGIAAVVLSIVLVFIFARLMSRFGPSRIVPAGFLLSSALHFVEYRNVQDVPELWSVAIYFHVVALGAILLSGFWSLMAETFDPRTAKQYFGRITGFGTLGGILGGVLAERVAKLSSAESVLLLLTAFHLLCAAVLLSGRRTAPHPPPSRALSGERDFVSPLKLFRRAPYLLMIALVVMAGTSSATILDFLFKSGASEAYGKGADLLRFFARFYISTQILTFLAQTWLARRTLQHLGIGRTLSSLPLSVGTGSLAALLIPGFPMYMLIRSAEYVLRGSLFRSAYELLYTPVPKSEKRAAKTLIDVVCDRSGDAVGNGVVQLLLWVGPSLIQTALPGVALALAASAIWISLRMDKAYTRLVQQRLVDRAVEFDLGDIQDFTTRSVLMPVSRAAFPRPSAPADLSIASPRATDSTLDMLRDLRSGDSKRVSAATQSITKLTPVVASQLLRLLAWDEARDAARDVLLRHPHRITGLLIDHLANPDTPFGVRRRVPKILACSDSQLAVHGLIAGLEDARFEVRFQCSRALDSLALRRPDLKIPADAIYAAAERELRVARPLWNSRRSLEKRTETDINAFLDEILRERADQSLEHVFSLFATILPREPIKVAFRALHTEDKALRGLAAEYLDSVLPSNIRERLWVMVESGAHKKPSPPGSGRDALEKLLSSHESLLGMIKKT